jgi:hypothetical protein
MTAPISPVDQRALILWDRYCEQKEHSERLQSGPATQAQCQVSFDALFAVEHLLQADIGASISALGAVLMVEIEGDAPEDVPGLYRAALAAIRQQLVGKIAEAADRTGLAPVRHPLRP